MRANQSSQDVRTMSLDQLDVFLEANGLQVTDGILFAPGGVPVGLVRQGKTRATLVLVNRQYVKEDHIVQAWWPSFRIAWRITMGDQGTVGPTLGPDEVICDLCNAKVQLRPVPVVNGYALCQACFRSRGLPFPGRVEPYIPAGGAGQEGGRDAKSR
ncbi:MAG: hypothetical protein U9R72_11080 [Chloroflexota bacterium]|nr:hypothetical protein [Chloroflexota bacterium]